MRPRYNIATQLSSSPLGSNNMNYKSILLNSAVFLQLLFGQDSLTLFAFDSFQMNSIAKMSNDSLVIITCADYVYYPFGKINTIDSLKSSVLKHFKVFSHFEKQENGEFVFHSLDLKSSHLLLWFDDDSEASIHSYILKGEIHDSSVIFVNSIRIGMDSKSFFSEFFYKYPKALEKCSTIIFESCVDDIKHIYSFTNGRLIQIAFKTDTHWKI